MRCPTQGESPQRRVAAAQQGRRSGGEGAGGDAGKKVTAGKEVGKEGSKEGARSGGKVKADSPAARRRYLERMCELFIDLMAQLPTRRFFHTVRLTAFRCMYCTAVAAAIALH